MAYSHRHVSEAGCPAPDKSARCHPILPVRGLCQRSGPKHPQLTRPRPTLRGVHQHELAIETRHGSRVPGPDGLARIRFEYDPGPPWTATGSLIVCHSIRPAQVKATTPGRLIWSREGPVTVSVAGCEAGVSHLADPSAVGLLTPGDPYRDDRQPRTAGQDRVPADLGTAVRSERRSKPGWRGHAVLGSARSRSHGRRRRAVRDPYASRARFMACIWVRGPGDGAAAGDSNVPVHRPGGVNAPVGGAPGADERRAGPS
jgi:hypothetical protein